MIVAGIFAPKLIHERPVSVRQPGQAVPPLSRLCA